MLLYGLAAGIATAAFWVAVTWVTGFKIPSAVVFGSCFGVTVIVLYRKAIDENSSSSLVAQ